MLPITRFVLLCTLRQHFGKYNVQMFLKKIFMVIHSKLHSCDVYYVVKSKYASYWYLFYNAFDYLSILLRWIIIIADLDSSNYLKCAWYII